MINSTQETNTFNSMFSCASVFSSKTTASCSAPYDAVEMYCDHLYFLAEHEHITLPWVLAITPVVDTELSHSHHREAAWCKLRELAVLTSHDEVHPQVREWIHHIGHSEQRIELRYVTQGDMLRGVIIPTPDYTLVVLRHAQLVTITALPLATISDLVPVILAGMTGECTPAQFTAFNFDLAQGVYADSALRNGTSISTIAHTLQIPQDSKDVIATVWKEHGCQVEIMAQGIQDGKTVKSPVGCTIIASTQGLVLMEPYTDYQPSVSTAATTATTATTMYPVWKTRCQPATTPAIAHALTFILSLVQITDWIPGHATS